MNAQRRNRSIDVDGRSTACPCHSTPRDRDLVPIVQEGGWAQGLVWSGADYSTPTRVQSLNCPIHSESKDWMYKTIIVPFFFMCVCAAAQQQQLTIFTYIHSVTILIGATSLDIPYSSCNAHRHISSLWGSDELPDDGIGMPKHIGVFD
jgi:hypothetical protein